MSQRRRPSANWRQARMTAAQQLQQQSATIPSTPQRPGAARQRLDALRARILETTGTTPETPASQQQHWRRTAAVPRGQASHVHRVMEMADLRAAYNLMSAAIDGEDEGEDDDDDEVNEDVDNESVDDVELRSGPQTLAVVRQMILELEDGVNSTPHQRRHMLHLLGALRPTFALVPFFASDPIVDTLTERQVYSTALTYARMQPEVFRRQYLENFLRDSASAYDDGTQVCLSGMKERLLFALAQATSGLLDHPRYGAEYRALAAALVPPDLTRSRLFGLISTCVESLRAQFGPDRAGANAAMVERCVRDRVRTDLGPLALLAPGAESLLRATMSEAAAEFVPPTPGGGTRARQKRRPSPRRRSMRRCNM